VTWKIVPPSDADWCVFTVGGKDDRAMGGGMHAMTQTDYWYEYVAGDEPTRDEASLFVPPGWEVLEFTVTATPHGKYAMNDQRGTKRPNP
jgi:hypothetical protein